MLNLMSADSPLIMMVALATDVNAGAPQVPLTRGDTQMDDS